MPAQPSTAGRVPGSATPAGGNLSGVDVVTALVQCGGVASWRRLRTLGVTAHCVWLGLCERRIQRLRRGVYTLPGADPHLLAAVTLGGVLSCEAAAGHHGLPRLDSDGRVHVTVPRDWAQARLAGVVVHRRNLPDDAHDGLVTGLVRTAMDCARELGPRDAVVVLDGVLRLGILPEELQAAAGAATGPGSAAVRRAVRSADGRAESPLESCLRLLVEPLGTVEPQVMISNVGRVDLLLDGWLVLEADGFEFHSARRQYREDRRRANALAVQGYVLLRLSYEDVMFRPDYVVASVSAVLRRCPAA